MNRIHINRNVIARNKKRGLTDPPISVRRYAGKKKTATQIEYGSNLEILDDNGNVVASVLYRPNDPLECGAQIWIETELEVKVGS